MDSLRISAILILLGFALFPVAAERAPDPADLVTAAESGDFAAVDRLIARGADPGRRSPSGRTALCAAVESGTLPVVERLLEASVDPDAPGPDGTTPLMAAVIRSRSDMVRLLLNAGADPNIVSDHISGDGDARPVSALSLAVDRGEFVLAGYLVERGADGLLLADPAPNAPNPLDLPSTRVPLDARIRRDAASLDDFAASPDWTGGAWPLHEAVVSGDWRGLKDALDGGANPDSRDPLGVTPLMAAARRGDAAAVSLLLRRGAYPLAVDSAGRNALCYAAASGRTDIVGSILAAPATGGGAESAPEVRDVAGRMRDGGPGDLPPALDGTPGYYAVIRGDPRMTEYLLDRIGPSDAVDEEGATLLMVAAWMADYRAVRSLLPLTDGVWDSGPPGEAARDDAGRTALEWSLAAFARDRRTGRETGVPERASRNYPIARLLAGRGKDPSEYGTVVSPDAAQDVIEAWSVGLNPRSAADWRDKLPAPVPDVPGDGDLVLYRILRDEEPGIPSGS